MNLTGRHLIDPNDFTIEELQKVIDLGLDIYNNPSNYSDICRGKILGTLFYEPSTRTRLSFESAMLRMGGSVLGFSDSNTSSVSKGETIADTIRVLDGYADVLVMRHPREGAPKLASEFSSVPVINGGDGGHQHPTQTLTDLVTIQHYRGKISNLKVAFCGDLLFGRTVHSLLKTLSRFPHISFVLISPEQLKIPSHLRDEIISNTNVEIIETQSLEDHINEVDILYMTRIQKERFFNEEEYVKLKDSYVLCKDKLKNAKEDLLILHPLPRVNEINYDVDSDPRAKYFEQAKLGVYARMALMALVLGVI
ncbi:aspartate carbamoyltransferase [Serpentinicella alkaliphila]|uniref:Aspartate carbamoyltransferase n=1 Tax=Serpentinicella alkaliphila TaxID=1734049 RepID=A0A4R2TK28_9FIRM|nr:aspartate carbamoyltransferase [Serpentinicella alkaliphila]QUH24712.1 aspartate carbamoyltransferase [Serpentinicella alkaliphila]TCQ03701.1 aspartate carbamoyltransferase [Serpentinicella alkaliphila]